VGTVTEEITVEASLAEVWDLYFEQRWWPSWVEGFGAVESTEGYPDAGGTLVWRSTPAGRGTVSERVEDHEPRRLHKVSYRDDTSDGELETTFAIEGEGTRVSQRLSYRLREHGAFGPLTDRLFVRRPVRGSMARSLARFKREAEARRPPSSL
jgi:uncharacterized membrane protein